MMTDHPLEIRDVGGSMSASIMRSPISADVKLAYFFLWERAEFAEKTICFHLSDLGRSLGRTERSASRWVKQLVELGLLEISGRTSGTITAFIYPASQGNQYKLKGEKRSPQKKLFEEADGEQETSSGPDILSIKSFDRGEGDTCGDISADTHDVMGVGGYDGGYDVITAESADAEKSENSLTAWDGEGSMAAQFLERTENSAKARERRGKCKDVDVLTSTSLTSTSLTSTSLTSGNSKRGVPGSVLESESQFPDEALFLAETISRDPLIGASYHSPVVRDYSKQLQTLMHAAGDKSMQLGPCKKAALAIAQQALPREEIARMTDWALEESERSKKNVGMLFIGALRSKFNEIGRAWDFKKSK